MSQEQQNKSDNAMQTTAPAAEVAQPPAAGPKRSPWVAIIAIIVVIALIATAFAVMTLGGQAQQPYLDIKITPSSINVPNGTQVRLNALVYLKNSTSDTPGRNITNSIALSITVAWQSGERKIGTISRGTSGVSHFWTFTSKMEGTSDINWTFNYRDPNTRIYYNKSTETHVVIGIAVLDNVQISPAEATIFKNTTQKFAATAYLTNGTIVNASIAWALENTSVGTLSATSGANTTLKAGMVDANGTLNCSATYLGRTVLSAAPIHVFTAYPPQQVTTRVYDLFNFPLGGWWYNRPALSQETPISWTYPIAYIYKNAPVGNDWLYSDFRMNITARNVTKCNTTSNLVYMPTFSPTVRGGNVHINWLANYITWDEGNKSLPPGIMSYYDTWFWRMNGTVTMDRTATKMILNMTDNEFNNFDTWKSLKFDSFKGALDNWLTGQMNVVWVIYYDYGGFDGQMMSSNYDIVKSGEMVTLIIKDQVSWGMDVVLPRWWKITFSDYEGWPEDVHFAADIGPLWSDFRLDAGFQYGLAAKINQHTGNPTWVFEEVHGDSQAGARTTGAYTYYSEFNPYASAPYWSWEVGNYKYGNTTVYSQTPWAIKLLNANDTWSVEWPANAKGYLYNGAGNFSSTVSGRVVPGWIDPLPGEVPSNMDLNISARKMTIKGPFDGWDWEKKTNGDREIVQNWSIVGALPRGVPYISLDVVTVANEPPIADISVSPIVRFNTPVNLISAGWDPDGKIVSWSWDFGDGGTSSVENPTHVWTTQGFYNVTLNVTDNGGLWKNDTVKVQVVGNFAPTALFNVPLGYIQVPTVFSAVASNDPDDNIIAYNWTFGDGTPQVNMTTPVVSHQYALPGMYNVSLRVKDSNITDPKYGTTNHTVGIQTRLTAEIAMPRTALISEVVQLYGNRSFTLDKTKYLANWSWDFGDGKHAYTENATHAWTSAGEYMVSLIVNDSSLPKLSSLVTTTNITIYPSTAVAFGMSLSKHSLRPSETATLTITAVNAAGDIDASYVGTANLAANTSSVTLPATAIFVAGVASVTVIATATLGSCNISAVDSVISSMKGYEFVTVAKSTVEIRIYDIFAYPLGSYWGYRGIYGDVPFRNNTPVVELYRPTASQIEAEVTSTYRVHVEANVTSINMTNPTFIPRMRVHEGGNLTISMNYHYLTNAEFWRWNRKNPDGSINFTKTDYLYTAASSAYDGWELWLNGNVTMDRAAAYQVLGLPQSVTDVASWWAGKNTSWLPPRPTPLGNYPYYYEHYFLGNESGIWSLTIPEKPIWGGASLWNGRLDIRAADDGYPIIGYGFMSCVYTVNAFGIANDTVTLRFVHINYGEDVLLSRWLYWGGIASGWNYPNGTPGGIMPWENYMDDFNMTVQMGPTMSNITIDFGQVYAFRAEKSHVASEMSKPIWRWDQSKIDYLGSSASLAANRSEMDLWYNRSLTYTAWNPGSAKFGWEVPYDLSPNLMTLAAGQSLIMERPDYTVSGYLPVGFVGNKSDPVAARDGYYDWLRSIERFGNATIHPVGASPGTAIVDAGSGDLKMVGPFYPIVEWSSTVPWLWYESAPRVEIWIG